MAETFPAFRGMELECNTADPLRPDFGKNKEVSGRPWIIFRFWKILNNKKIQGFRVPPRFPGSRRSFSKSVPGVQVRDLRDLGKLLTKTSTKYNSNELNVTGGRSRSEQVKNYISKKLNNKNDCILCYDSFFKLLLGWSQVKTSCHLCLYRSWSGVDNASCETTWVARVV